MLPPLERGRPEPNGAKAIEWLRRARDLELDAPTFLGRLGAPEQVVAKVLATS